MSAAQRERDEAAMQELAVHCEYLAARILGDITGCTDLVVVGREDVVHAVGVAFAFGQAVARNQAAGIRTCRVCGCTEEQACEGRCHWVLADLCSTCADRAGQ